MDEELIKIIRIFNNYANRADRVQIPAWPSDRFKKRVHKILKKYEL